MSVRKTIVDAVITALESIPDIGTVTTDINRYYQQNESDLPMLYVTSQILDKDWLTYPSDSAADMQAELQIEISGMIEAQYATDTRANLDALMEDVEQAVIHDSDIEALVVDINGDESQYDFDVQDRYGMCQLTYNVSYTYNHSTP